mgnify:FL=1
MTPYRASAPSILDEVVTIPWWQLAWFRVYRSDAAQCWPWARRAIGGRWSQRFMGRYFEVEYVQCDVCPGSKRVDSFCEIFRVCTSRRCFCEVYP